MSKLEPVVAAPHSPDNRKLARECRDVKIDRVYIGSCTGGKTEDFLSAAKLLHVAGQQVKVPTYLVPATQKVRGGPCRPWQEVTAAGSGGCDGGGVGWVWAGWRGAAWDVLAVCAAVDE